MSRSFECNARSLIRECHEIKGLTIKFMGPDEPFVPNIHHTDIFITSLLHHCHKTFTKPLYTMHMPRFHLHFAALVDCAC